LQDCSTDFEFLPIDVSLGRCQRYFQVLDGSFCMHGTAGQAMANYYRNLVQMRASPTATRTTAGSATNVSGTPYFDEVTKTGARIVIASTADGRTFLTNFVYTLDIEL